MAFVDLDPWCIVDVRKRIKIVTKFRFVTNAAEAMEPTVFYNGRIS